MSVALLNEIKQKYFCFSSSDILFVKYSMTNKQQYNQFQMNFSSIVLDEVDG